VISGGLGDHASRVLSDGSEKALDSGTATTQVSLSWLSAVKASISEPSSCEPTWEDCNASGNLRRRSGQTRPVTVWCQSVLWREGWHRKCLNQLQIGRLAARAPYPVLNLPMSDYISLRLGHDTGLHGKRPANTA
jgi:hypothetical protein